MRAALVPLLLALALALPAHAQTIDARLRDELLAMRSVDQSMRRDWLAHPDNAELKKQMDATDASHLERLREIVREHGWPGKSLVTDAGSAAAWIIVQHGGPAAIKEMLPVMTQAAKSGELSASLVAASIDRDLLNDRKPQRYGTQFDVRENICAVRPLEDPARVDELRKQVGLGPLAAYAEQLCKTYVPGVKPQLTPAPPQP
jgi:hypothetical protein